MKNGFDPKELIEYAVRAPSGHNTQPWLFSIQEDEIHIHPDLNRTLSVVDGDDHALYISLGCAAENIVIAATKYGFESSLTLVDSEPDGVTLKISLTAGRQVRKDPLADQIRHRQSTRNEYRDEQVPDVDLARLKKSFSFDGVKVSFFTGPDEIKALEPLLIEGSNLQIKNKQFVEELVQWIRFTKSDAKKKGDGLWSRCMGLPNIPRVIGKFVMRRFVTARSEAKRWKKLIDSTAGFALFTVDKNEIGHWIGLGRAFQRFALTATRLNIRHAHVNMPCEEPAVRQKLISRLGLGSRHPLLLIRFGYSEKMPYSFRRAVEEVTLNVDQPNNG